MSIRIAAAKNQFYPGNPQILKQMIMQLFENTDVKKINEKIKAIIVPHAGYIYSGEVAAYAYKLLKHLDPDKNWKVLLLGPSHQIPFIGAAVSNDNRWETPLGLVSARDIRSEIKKSANVVDVFNAHKEEHSLEVQVPFLQMSLKNFTIYPLCLGDVRSDFLANDLADFCKNDDVIAVISTDLSHYLPYDDAKEIDLITSAAIVNLDIDTMIERGDACGRMGVLTGMFLAEKLGWKCKMLKYLNSGDTAGDKSRVVGYGAYVMYE